MFLNLLLLLARVLAAFRPAPRPAGRHAAGLVDLVPADYNPLSDGLRYRVRAAALRKALA